MAEIMQHIGYEAAMKLLRHFGGTTVMIPYGKCAWPEDIESVIGSYATKQLVHAFGGNRLYIPMRYKDALLQRNITICLEYDDEFGDMTSKEAIQLLARRHSLSDRSIYLILKGTDPAVVAVERKRRRVVHQESDKRSPAGSVPSKTN